MKLDKFQRIVALAYEGGEYSWMKREEQVRQSGDGLFIFLISEIAQHQDCDSVEEAIRRLDTITREVQEVRYAFLNLPEKEEKNRLLKAKK